MLRSENVPALFRGWCLCLCAWTAGPLLVDAEIPDLPDLNAEPSGVYLNDSFEAADAMRRAEQLTRRGRWTQAAQTLQRAAETYADRLTQRAPGCYVDLRRHIAHTIAAWPKAGIAAYRQLYDRVLDESWAKLNESHDVEDLLPLLDLYFSTSGAVKLLDRITNLAVEAGDFALARRLLQRGITRHPDRDRYGPRWKAKLRLIDAMEHPESTDVSGDCHPAEGAQPGDDLPHSVLWMGKTETLDTVLKQIHESFGTPRPPPAADQWPLFGGQPDRTRIGTTRVDELGLLWRVDLTTGGDADAQTPFYEGDALDHRVAGMVMQPVVQDGLLIVQHLRQVTALNINTGADVWHFRADAGIEPDPDEFDEFPIGWYSPTIHGQRVYITLPGDMAPYYGYESAQSLTELVCLDLTTGRPIWRANRMTQSETFKELHFDSSPIIDNGRLYVIGRRRRSFGFEDCYLHCFRSDDGRLIYRTHLGSASTGSFGSQQATVSILALEGNTVYVCTNLGSVAAVAAHTGSVRWLRLYGRTGAANTHGTSWSTSEVNPWEFNAIMVHNGKVICLPIDSDDLIVYDHDDGTELFRIPIEALSRMRTLLGVREDILCGSGREAVCFDLARRAQLWSSPIPRNEPVLGRGRWIGNSLYVPTASGLNIFDTADGSLKTLSWDPEGHGGNLLGLPDRIIVASARHISAYVQKNEIWALVRQRMEAAPTDPAPALDLAEIAFGSGEFAEAMNALQEAVRRTEGFSVALEPALKSRLFTDAVTFANKLANHDRLTRDDLERLQGIASSSAPTQADHIRFRTSFARLYVQLKQPARAVRLLQQILQDTTLRESPAGTRPDGTATAGATAYTGIKELIALNGRDVYASFDRLANERLKSALDQSRADLLAQLVESYPNSEAAPKALVAWGDLVAATGDATDAVATYSAAYHRYPNQVDRPRLLRKIADTYERAGQLEHAYLWLTKASREHPNATVSYEGRRLTFAQYRRRLEHVRAGLAPARPHITLPLNRTFSIELAPPALLLSPLFDDKPNADWSRYFARSHDGINAYASGSDRVLWPHPFAIDESPRLLIATNELALFATDVRIFALKTDTGTLAWTVGRDADSGDAAPTDWEDEDHFRRFALDHNRLVAGKQDGTLRCLDIRTGTTIWARAEYPPVGRRICIQADWVVFDCLRGGETSLILLDMHDGSAIEIIDTHRTQDVEDVFLTLDKQIILITSHDVNAYQVSPGQLRWSVTIESQLQRDTLLLDVDAFYVCDDARGMKKLGLDDGSRLWTSPRILPRGQQEIAAKLLNSNIIMSSSSVIAAIDAISKLVLWEATTPQDPRFLARRITDAYFLAVHIPDRVQDRDGFAFFYDHRHGSGMIARDGGRLNLGRLDQVQTILAVDDTLLIQTGNTIRGWSHGLRTEAPP
ncbi:MAG: PQQ-binding-like beta-propeller repeat protein [Phycisphaerae bacterium]